VSKLSKSIYIDALALVSKNKSGVGMTLQQTLAKLLVMEELKDYTIYLVVPLGKAKALQTYVGQNVKTKTIFLPARLLQALMKTGLLLPVDWFLGSGIYVFPNYRNWPLWRSRSLTYVYDTVFISYPETVQVKNQKYLSRYINTWLGRTDMVITISEQVRLEIEKLLHVYYGKIDLVPCGVDRSIYKKSSLVEVQRVKDKYAIPYEKYLLFVGNIEPRKNLVALMGAYAGLPKRPRDQYGLVIVGADGWLNQSFRQKLVESQQAGLNIFKVEGYMDGEDLPAIYSGASLLVHPAVYEGFGMTPLEAMACETPVAVSDLPVMHEVVQNAGEYFNPLNTESITRAILNVLDDPKRKDELIREGLARSAALSWSNSAAKLFDAIEEQLKSGPKSHPLLTRLRALYSRFDRLLRRLLGERAFKKYRPATAANINNLRRNLYDDFINEQPARWQIVALSVYLGTKHAVAKTVRLIYQSAKAS
jgi:glycosyltransferase involved in cell wall biosynthesis